MEIMDEDYKINADNIDVEEIMSKIKQNIKERGYTEEEIISNFDFTPEKKIGVDIDGISSLHHSWNINLEKEIESSPGIIGKSKIFFKKSIRKLVRPYIKPIIEEQIGFNAQMVRVIDELNERINNLDGSNFNMNYLEFENQYRGSEEGIQNLQRKFVKYFDGKDNILDIGCGRGEFIKELLLDGKKKVLGIDMNAQMIGRCLSENLPVKHLNGVNYLNENSNLKLEGIFSSQVVEHLSPSQIVSLIEGAQKNLVEDGVLILETINPMCLFAHTMSYPLDLTHKQLVHPYTLKFLLEERGFKNIEIMYTSINDEDTPMLKIDNTDTNEFNEKIEKMHSLLFGAQDYAIIARK